jgi:AraC-like DNA-binding protein
MVDASTLHRFPSRGIRQLGRLDHFGIRLRPGGAAAVLGLRSDGAAPIAGVARAHGLGYKRLERIFLRQVGLTPKHVARIARLQRALGAASPPVALADLAARAGYADQAHLTRDFAQPIGLPPGAFFAERFAVYETMKASGAIGRR